MKPRRTSLAKRVSLVAVRVIAPTAVRDVAELLTTTSWVRLRVCPGCTAQVSKTIDDDIQPTDVASSATLVAPGDPACTLLIFFSHCGCPHWTLRARLVVTKKNLLSGDIPRFAGIGSRCPPTCGYYRFHDDMGVTLKRFFTYVTMMFSQKWYNWLWRDPRKRHTEPTTFSNRGRQYSDAT